MTSRLLQNIKHTGDYNPGGISGIYLLDVRDLISFRFRDDNLYDSCYIERIVTDEPFRQLDTVTESEFNETYESGIYKQQLNTFVRTLDADTLARFLTASTNRYIVVFETFGQRMYCFGSDGGASVAISQISGQSGTASGYRVAIVKNSVYPLFEINPERFNVLEVLGSECRQTLVTEDMQQAILLFGTSRIDIELEQH